MDLDFLFHSHPITPKRKKPSFNNLWFGSESDPSNFSILIDPCLPKNLIGMPISSYIGSRSRGGGGGGWASALLPTTTTSSSSSKSKLPRKSRRRALLRDFFFANFFTIGLCLSVFLFLAVLFRFGGFFGFAHSPPLSSATAHFKSRASRLLHRNRKPSVRSALSNDAVSGALVDITTKDLYDKIEFLDVDGGAWKQGWKVSYSGNEWDRERLKIFVVPHSHNDPGWKLTVEEYYEKQSRHILDTIVDTLSKVISLFIFQS